MTDDLWAERDTTPPAIEAALRALLSERYRDDRSCAPARVINLVAIVDAAFRGEIENRLARIGRFHPSRTIVCAVHPRRETLDATASLTDELDAVDDALEVVHERIEVECGTRHLERLDRIVDPLVVSDVATVVWAPHGHEQAVDALREIAQVVLYDSLSEPEPGAALRRVDELLERHHVVDLSWLRSTPWRERTAAAFDLPVWRARLPQLSRVVVRHRHDSVAAAALFVGWLASRLGWRVERLVPVRGEHAGHARTHRTDVHVVLREVEQDAPGLSGVTIEVASGETVTLDRAPGGLATHRRLRDGRELRFRLLGASRGESGILGEGVRQALLRDRTYQPAVAAARTMVATA